MEKVDLNRVALNKAKMGSHVSDERISEIMSDAMLNQNPVAISREEAIACGIQPVTAKEAAMYLDDEKSNLYAISQTDEFKNIVTNLTSDNN